MPSVRRITLALGLFLFGVGLALFAIGGAGIVTSEIVRGALRGGRTLTLLIAVGLSLLAVASGLVAYSIKQTA